MRDHTTVTMSIPPEVLPHIQCSICNKHLSYFPINVKQSTSEAVCGRCSSELQLENDYVRATLYETMATIFKFPCIYHKEGCVEYLTPAEVPAHEENCSYRTIYCALECIWQGTLTELCDHIEDAHPSAILRDGEFELDVVNSYDIYSFLPYNDEMLKFRREFDATEKMLKCSVSSYKTTASAMDYFYEVSITNGTRSLTKKFPLKTANSHEENVTKISMVDVMKMLDDPLVVIGCVKLFMSKSDAQGAQERKKNPNINDDMLRELECPVCLCPIIPPIYQCITGHSICGVCKVTLRECPTCKGDLRDTRNFVLEKMAYFITYPCKYYEYGCDFASTPAEMQKHFKYCLFGPVHCPLRDYAKCIWKKTAKDVYEHVNKSHRENLLEVDKISAFTSGEDLDEECYIKKFSNVMFKIHYKYHAKVFFWAVQLIGPPDEAKEYRFELDIVDNQNHNQKIFVRRICAPFSEKTDAFKDKERYVSITMDTLKALLSDQLTYFLRITK